jgi:chromosome partitioning protein
VGEALASVVAFLSQKGGVGKSTLARSLAVVAADAGLKVIAADLDPQQRTLLRWLTTREQYGAEPLVEVAAFESAQEAVEATEGADLLILDMPGQLTNQITGIAGSVQLIVQPTSPSVDDLHPSMLVFQALQRVRIPRERLAFALCRVLGEKEAEATRDYLQNEGYTVLRGAIYERQAYRDALNLGRALNETRQQTLNSAARLMMLDLLNRALTVTVAKGAPSRRIRRKA